MRPRLSLLRTRGGRRAALALSAAAVGALVAVTCRSPNNATPPPATLPASREAATTASAAQHVVPLTIKVTGIRNRKGQMIFGVFKSADGFPKEGTKAVVWEVRDVDGDTMTFTASLPPGRYGASVLHDENRSGDMDTGLGGIPTEGYGVTNNPKPRFRAATFEGATFTLPPEGATMTISMQYF